MKLLQKVSKIMITDLSMRYCRCFIVVLNGWLAVLELPERKLNVCIFQIHSKLHARQAVYEHAQQLFNNSNNRYIYHYLHIKLLSEPDNFSLSRTVILQYSVVFK